MGRVVTASRRGSGGKRGPDAILVPVFLAVIAISAVVVFLRREGGNPAPAPGGATSAEAAPAGPAGAGAPARGPSGGTAPAGAKGGAAPQAAVPGDPPHAATGTANGAAEAPRAEIAEGADADEQGQKPEPPPAAFREKEYFDNPVENILASVSEPGAEFVLTPPRVTLSDEEIIAILKRPVEIYEDDDDEAARVKERTAAFKTEALAFIEAGGTYNQFVRDKAAAATEQANMVEDVRQEMIRLLRTSGRKAAEEYLAEANPVLREQGLREVIIPKMLLIELEKERK